MADADNNDYEDHSSVETSIEGLCSAIEVDRMAKKGATPVPHTPPICQPLMTPPLLRA